MKILLIVAVFLFGNVADFTATQLSNTSTKQTSNDKSNDKVDQPPNPNPQPIVDSPKAVLSRLPSKSKLIIITTKGTIGNDPKFLCFPENNEWQEVILDGTPSIILASTNEKLTFILAVNKNNLTATATLTLSPDDVPDDFDLNIEKAIKIDKSSGSFTEHFMNYSLIYKNSKPLIDNSSTNSELIKEMSNLINSNVGTSALPNTRKAVSIELQKKLPRDPNAPINKPLLNDLFQRVHKAIDRIINN